MSSDFPDLRLWQDGCLAGWDSSRRDGPVMHLLHGNGFCSRVLEPMARVMHQQSPAGQWLFTDLPGHGQATAAPASPDWASPDWASPDWNRMADEVAASLTQRADGPVIGIGHSLGGVITLLAAARYPPLFERIILIDPVIYSTEVILFQALMQHTGLWRQRPFIQRVQQRQCEWPDRAAALASLRRKGLYREWDDAALQAFVNFALSDVPEGVQLACHPHTEAAIFASRPRQLWSSVKQLGCPADILVADRSYPFVGRAARRASSLNSRIRQHPVSGSHCVAMENPQFTATEINKLLAG